MPMQGSGGKPDTLSLKMAQAVRLQQQERYQDAERLYREVLAMAPDHADANHFLGLLAHQTGRPTLAVELMERSLAISPNNAGFLNNLGGVLQEQGALQKAVDILQRAIAVQPGYADAWHHLALALERMQLHAQAVVCWERAVKLAPGLVSAWLALGDTLWNLGQLDAAIDAYEKARQFAPDDARVLSQLGCVLVERGLTERGLQMLDAAIRHTPESAHAHFQMGQACVALGRFREAAARLRRALALQPDLYAAYTALAGISALKCNDPEVKALQRMADDARWSNPADGVAVYFALGKLHQQQQHYDVAFRYFLQGNRLQRQQVRYSTAAQRANFDLAKSTFGGEFQHRHAAAGLADRLPIFIVGMPRSGTSLVEQILASHPEVHGGGELQLIHEGLRKQYGTFLSDRDELLALGRLADEELRELAQQCLDRLHTLNPRATRVTDKRPANFALLGLLHVLFPHAVIIHCRRDPLDTCVSCFFTQFQPGQEYAYDLTELGEYYREYQRCMTYWHQLLPVGRIYEVHYEKLITDFETEARGLVAHCGLEWHADCANFHTNPRQVATASAYQVRQPLYHSAVGRARSYRRHLGPLFKALDIIGEE